MDNIFRFLTFCAALALCACYPHFQESIPNGKNVPHPCVDGYIWEGVGHENPRGGSARNAFGVDLKKNNIVWDSVLCNLDSDGDGKTNGEELGDPDCTWTPGSTPKYTTGLSHPGTTTSIESKPVGTVGIALIGQTDFANYVGREISRTSITSSSSAPNMSNCANNI